MNTSFKIFTLGDQAITVIFGDQINIQTNNKVLTLFNALKANPITGVLDLVPAYCSLTMVYDIIEVKKNFANQQTAYKCIEEKLSYRIQNLSEEPLAAGRKVQIPVCYDLSLAPDLQYIADQHSLSPDEVINIHTSTTYHVYMIGFLPGFPYMATVDKQIATPRKVNPRTNVPAGSVGIAGDQTGIYPVSSPGGWQLIGQTSLQLFDQKNDSPTLFQPGDQVQFYPISLTEFHQLKHQ